MDAIAAEGLEKRYQDVQALAGVSFSVRAGRSVSLGLERLDSAQEYSRKLARRLGAKSCAHA